MAIQRITAKNQRNFAPEFASKDRTQCRIKYVGIDSQSIKIAERGGVNVDDGGKKISGRKRYLLFDTVGLILKAKVHAADILDNRGRKLLLENLKSEFPYKGFYDTR